MHIFKTVDSVRKYIVSEKSRGNTIGFVPTMGALHEGHLSLMQLAAESCDEVVCSIFVNPTQFNEASDLEKYPRPIEQDILQLSTLPKCHLFLPSVEEVYPNGVLERPTIDLGNLPEMMEGEHRPGHFEGVVQVVHRLLTIVEPTVLVMGQKDYQQFTIIQRMLDQTGMPTRLVVAPIKRESDGLAMSSRNVLLEPGFRQKAPVIFKTLQWAREHLHQLSVSSIKEEAIQHISDAGLQPEYFDLVHGKTLEALDTYPQSQIPIVACTAAWAGKVRLIDNMILN